jgi:hypothetical protein
VITAILILRASPELYDQVLRQALEQQPDIGLTPEDLDALILPIGFFMGLCIGLIELLFALGAGVLGGWLAVRQRPTPPAPPMDAPFVPPGAPVGS